MFSSPDLRVVKDADSYFLESASFAEESDHMAVFEEAKRLLPLLNGAARLRTSSHRDVSLNGQLLQPSGDGEAKQFNMILTKTLHLRSSMDAVIVRPGEAPPADPPPGSALTDRWLRLAAIDSDAAETLTYWGSKPRDWHNLYKVLEIIESRADIESEGWATARELKAFTGSANHQGAAGADARHSRMKGHYPTQRAIPLPEAEAFIGHLLTSWLASLPDLGSSGTS
jgi:hypothetical protein